jgi:hypothetical protein
VQRSVLVAGVLACRSATPALSVPGQEYVHVGAAEAAGAVAGATRGARALSRMRRMRRCMLAVGERGDSAHEPTGRRYKRVSAPVGNSECCFVLRGETECTELQDSCRSAKD